MKIRNSGSALALLILVSAPPALAQDTNDHHDSAQGEPALLHPGAALMNEHMHEAGEVMIGLRFERNRWSGANQTGTEELADSAILAAGYSVRTKSMTMDMVMLDLMFAPTDNLTLMVMPHYMWHRMEMVGIDPANGATGGHAGHGPGPMIPFGGTHGHSTDGFGDTLASASYRLVRDPGFGAHATLGVWVPTGAVDRKNANGTFVHYGMQSGSGTWDLEPALTVSGRSGSFGWGAQAAYRWRTETSNASGFAFGDKARATGWVSYRLASSAQATGRLEFTHEGQVLGHYNGAHNHAAPPDRQANYGGDVAMASLGLTWKLPGEHAHPQISAELGVPIYQDLKGIQAPQDWRLTVAISQAF